MSPGKIPFTKAAYEKMQQEFEAFSQELKEILERLKVAREMGDLSENGAYKYAKFELGNTRRRLSQLKHLLDNGEIVEDKNTDGTIGFGSTVNLLQGNKPVTYSLVSKHESDIQKNKLSTESPLGQAIVGKRKGDQVTIKAPTGFITYDILEVT